MVEKAKETSSVMSFSRKRKMFPFEIENQDGSKDALCVVELMGDEVENWLDETQKNVTVKGQTARLKSFKGMYARLLTKTVYWRVEGNQIGERVGIKYLQELPHTMQVFLYNKAEKLSELDKIVEKKKKKAKND